jgi:aspartate-semialdehyde dehydrogenase
MKKIAIISPSSLVGREVLGLLAELPGEREVTLFSEKMAGTEQAFGRRELVVEDLDEELLIADGAPVAAIFAGVPAQPLRLARPLAEAGTRVIDLTSAFRGDAAVPLLSEPPAGPLPPLVSLPGGNSLAAYRALQPLLEPLGLLKLDATLLVPVSGSGAAGVRELSRQTAKLLSGGNPKTHRFPHRIAFNVLPGPGGRVGLESRSELGFRQELRRMLGRADLPVTVSAALVPVFFGLSLGLTFETERPATLAGIEAHYRAASPGLHKLLTGSGADPMPSLAAGDRAVLLGRVRGEGRHWQLWACADPLRMRADLAVSIAERLL